MYRLLIFLFAISSSIFLFVNYNNSGNIVQSFNNSKKYKETSINSFSITSNKKESFNIDSSSNNLYIFNIWTTWCVFCKPDINFLNNISKKNNIKIFFLNMDEKKEYYNYIKKNKLTTKHPVILDWENKIPSQITNHQSLPITVFLYKGKIIKVMKENLEKSFSPDNFSSFEEIINNI